MEKMKREQYRQLGHSRREERWNGRKETRIPQMRVNSYLLSRPLNTSLYLIEVFRKPWMCEIPGVPFLIDSYIL